MSDDVRRLIDLVEAQLGLRVEDKVAAAAIARRSRGWIDRVAQDPAELRALASELTIGETYFYRHTEQLAAFRDIALADRLAASPDHVRILSAGCSSGEEPYTLAMITREAAPDQTARIAIDAVDINAQAIEKARKARYTRWSLRSVPADVEQRWFVREDSTFTVVPQIRNAVAFARANLTDALTLPGLRYDVIFCRNVLMYFAEQALYATVERLVTALVPGGFLFLGHAEILRHAPAGVALCESHGTFYYRRGERIARRIATAPPPDASWFTTINAASERVQAMADRVTAAESTTPYASSRDSVVITAREAIAREDYRAALALLEPLPALGDVVLLRAIAMTELGDAAAADVRDALLSFEPHAAHAHYLRAVASESAGDLVAAARHATRAVELAPELAMPHLRLALVARRMGDVDTARRELALAIDAFTTEAPERLALFAGSLGRDALLRLCHAELAALEETA